MEDGVTEAKMPRARDLGEALHQHVGLARHELRQNLAVQPREECRVTGQKAAVEQRDGELDIVLVEARAVVERARGRTDTQADVPHLLADAPHWLLHVAAQRFVLRQKKQVNIGMRKQSASPEAAQRDQREAGAVAAGNMLLPEVNGQLIDNCRTVAHRGCTRTVSFELRPQPFELLPVMRAQCVIGRRAGHGSPERNSGRCSHNAVSPRSSLRMRIASSMRDRKILPSPIFPVRAALLIACIAESTSRSGSTVSIFTLGRTSTVYSRPR